jgi:hypothetical protein
VRPRNYVATTIGADTEPGGTPALDSIASFISAGAGPAGERELDAVERHFNIGREVRM